MPPTLQVPSLGRVVHYVLPDSSPRRGEHRSARVTSTHGGDLVNLTIDYDQADDVNPAEYSVIDNNFVGRAWSVKRDDTAGTYGTWHFPEYVAPLEAPAPAASVPPPYTPPPPQFVQQFEDTVTGNDDTNEHGIGPDVGTGPNPAYVPPTENEAATQGQPTA